MVEQVLVPPIQKEVEQPPITEQVKSDYYGIPVDCLKHFSISMHNLSGAEISQLRDIVDWAKTFSDGNVIKNISNLQIKLGSPALNEKNYEKAWRFVKMQKLTSSIIK